MLFRLQKVMAICAANCRKFQQGFDAPQELPRGAFIF